MRLRLIGLSIVFFNFFFTLTTANGQELYLKELHIEGNHLTKIKYIMSCITLNEGESYPIDQIIEEITKSKKNLINTNLFTDVFFDDKIDENNNLVLVIKVREKNYLHFRPSGYIFYGKNNFHLHQSLYINYINLSGNGSKLEVELPIYDTTGFCFKYNSTPSSFRYLFSGGYFSSSVHIPSEIMWVEAGGSFSPGLDLRAGLKCMFFRDIQKNIVLSPFLEWGNKIKPDEKAKNWIYIHLSPSAGYNLSENTFYTFSSKLQFYRALLLRMIYLLGFGFELQGGSVPDGLKLHSSIRGTDFLNYTGNIALWVTNELRFPLPWNNNIVIVPFFDFGTIGGNSFSLLAGGGIGFRWFSRYTDPLVVDFAAGKGIMLNFQKIF